MYSLCVNALVRYSIKRRPLYPLVSIRTPLPRGGRTKDVMQVLFHKHVWLYSEYMPTLHWWTGASSMSPYVMTVTWSIASGIILHHRYIAYELFLYCSSLIYFSAATFTITTKPKNITFATITFCHHYHYYHITLLLNTLLQILSFQVWLNWQPASNTWEYSLAPIVLNQ